MSWFLGYSGKHNEKLDNYFISLNLEENMVFTGSGVKILFGCKAGNIIYDYENNAGTVICGITLTEGIDKKALLKNLTIGRKYDGHYAGVNFTPGSVELFNDALGLRDIYYIELEENTIFSTRVNYLTAYLNNIEIDLEEFSSLWLLPHKISWGSIIKGIKKLGPGGRLKITGNEYRFTRKLWTPEGTKTSPDDFLSALEKATLYPAKYKRNINLGLSGGLDSRVLLQVLCSSKYKNWATHTFGPKDLPDVELSEIITRRLEIKHYFLEQHPVTPVELLNNKLFPLLELSSPIAGMINYSFFEYLNQEGYTIIDGGNGEIFRRAFLNRFLMMGKDALLNKDIPKIFSLLKRENADIFNEGVNEKLTTYAKTAISNILEVLEPTEEVGVEQWLDLFFIKTKAANISGPSQAILDNISNSYMPFVQLSVLNAGFNLNSSERNNASLFMKIIKNGKAGLTKFPLVKDNTYYPFNTGLFTSRVIQKAKRKLGLFYKDNSRYNALLGLKEFAKDKLYSQDVKSFAMYDYKKVSSLVTGFYDDNKTELTNQLNWWISFEIWREGLSKTRKAD